MPTKVYHISLSVLCTEEFTEDEISARIEFTGFSPFIEVIDCHIEEDENE